MHGRTAVGSADTDGPATTGVGRHARPDRDAAAHEIVGGGALAGRTIRGIVAAASGLPSESSERRSGEEGVETEHPAVEDPVG